MKLNIYPSKVKNYLPGKLVRIMKLTFFLLLVLTMEVNAVAKAQQISLNETDASIESVLQKIKAQSNYSVLFNDQMIADANPVTIKVKDVPVVQALDACFKNQPLTYEIINNTIILRRRTVTRIEITGRVTDASGKALPGVNVYTQREKKTVSTDQNGIFTIQAEIGDRLMIKMMGFEDYSIVITHQ